MGPVLKISGTHGAKEGKVFLNATVSKGAFRARLRQRAALGANGLLILAVHISQPLFDQRFSAFVDPLKVIRGVERPGTKGKAQPSDVALDRLGVVGRLLRGVRIIEAKVAAPPEDLGHAEVQTDGFGVPKMQVAIGFRGKASDHGAPVLTLSLVLPDALGNEVVGAGAFGTFVHGGCLRLPGKAR